MSSTLAFFALLSFHPLFTDHAVVSESQPRPLGQAEPGQVVTVSLAGSTVKTTADASGRWAAEFPPLPAGGPHTLSARTDGEEITSRDILLGQVWLGSGQSNMEWTLSQTKDTEADIAAADEPRLRVFTVPKTSSSKGPASTVGGRWQVSTPRDAGGMSAVGYFFGRRMINETQRPFGMIISAWGGSAISQWMTEDTLRARPEYSEFVNEIERVRSAMTDPAANRAHEDPGIAPQAKTWSEPSHDDSAWTPIPVPGKWQDIGWDFNGAVWYRRSVEIPADWVGQDLEFALGIVDDYDHTFVNGTLVGTMAAETPAFWATPRIYKVPAALVTSTTVNIAVRAFDIWGGGGLMGTPALQRPNRPDIAPVILHDLWRAQPELKLPSRSPGGPPPSTGALFNGMIAPLAGIHLDGVIWYQGESDTSRAQLYPRMLTDLIHSWRNTFNAPALPFGIVQLANFRKRESEPVDKSWAHLREAQRLVALHEPATGLALAIDAGEADDIHPRDKKTVGERLALWALHTVYGRKDLAYSGPLFVESWAEDGGMRLRFSHASGMRVRGEALRGFQLAGADLTKWVWADEATIRGDTVFVRAASVPQPAAVRYAWQDNPETTLENAAGLPASPFRTDN